MLTKAQLLRKMDEGRERWEQLIDAVPPDRLREPGVVGVWSMRDLIAHIAGYERAVGARLLSDLDGRPLSAYGIDEVPPDGLDDDATNAWVVARAQGHTPDEVRVDERQSYALLRLAIERLSEAEVADPTRFSWLDGRAVAQILAGQSFGHYAEHEPAIRSWSVRPRGAT